MFSDKLISLLQTFSRVEMTRLHKFLLSPYFNEQKDVTRLFEWVGQAIRKSDVAAAPLSKEKVWAALYPKQALDDAHLRRLASDLTQLALHFLVQEARQLNPLGAALELQKVLDRPELKKHLDGTERQIIRLLESAPGKSSAHYLAQFQAQWHIFSRDSKVMASADYMEKLRPADQYLEYFYVVQKLKFYVAWLSYRTFRSTDQELSMIGGFWQHIEDERFANIPLIAVYRQVVACLTEPNEEGHFRQLLLDLQEKGAQIIREDLRECYHIAQNYCAIKINQGQNDYYREMFAIFRITIEKELLLEDGRLSEGVYKNIITVSLGVGEYAWAEQFIQQYAVFLPVSIRENARTFNLAYLYFHLKQYPKVIELLRNVEYSDVVYALSAKLTLVRTYYETDEVMALDSLIDSFRIFLRRNKIMSKNQKREYNNFLNFVKKLASMPLSDPAAVAKLRQRVTEAASTMPKKWLLEKMDELKRK